MQIRIAIPQDREAINAVYSHAFSEGEREIVAQLALSLLAEAITPPILSLVAESDSVIVGHGAFSPMTSKGDKTFQGYILAPLGIKPDYQKRGIGSEIIESGKRELIKKGVQLLFVYGDPRYYSRFGFSVELAKRYLPPYKLQYPFGWQACALNQNTKNKAKTHGQLACVTSLCDPKLW